MKDPSSSPNMPGGDPSGICPNCGGASEYQNARYPEALCHQCDSRATDMAARPVSMYNVSMSGGFEARHVDDGTVCGQVTADGRVLVDGREWFASEAHM